MGMKERVRAAYDYRRGNWKATNFAEVIQTVKAETLEEMNDLAQVLHDQLVDIGDGHRILLMPPKKSEERLDN